MEFKELTEKDFKITHDWNNETKYECIDYKNNVFSYTINYYSGENPPINDWDGETRYYADIACNFEEVCVVYGKSLQEIIEQFNQVRKELIQDLMEVPNAKKD